METLFDVSSLNAEIDKLKAKTTSPDFYEDTKKSSKVLKQINLYESKISRFDALSSLLEEVETLVEMAEEEETNELNDEIATKLAKLESQTEKFRLETLLSGPYDATGAIMTIHPGAGGTESCDWADMLLRMYKAWADKQEYQVKMLDFLPGDVAGIKSVTIEISGDYAYGYAKCEKGVHRLVRISPFDSSGRRHTSFVAVEVMPVIDEDIEVEIADSDLKIDTFRASGAGGQHINKTSSAVRITHLPTGIVTSCQTERSQLQNKNNAMKMLKAKLYEILEEKQLEKIDDIKGEQKEIAWGSQIRSYVFHPYNMVKDHRTNYEVGNIGAVMDGELNGFINARLTQIAGEKDA